MADTLPNIEIPKDTTIDLFATVGVIPNGKRLRVVNIGSSEVRLYSGENTPTVVDGYVVLKPYSAAENASGDIGAFATSISSNGKLAVEVF